MSNKNQSMRSDAESLGLLNDEEVFGKRFVTKTERKNIRNIKTPSYVRKTRKERINNINKITGKRPVITIDQEPVVIIPPVVTEQTTKPTVTSPPQTETKQIKKDKHYGEGLTLENGKIVSDTKRNRSILNRESKIFNSSTKRWIMNTEQNRLKIEQDKIALQKALELKRLEEQQGKIRQLHQRRAALKIQQQYRIHVTKQRNSFIISLHNKLTNLTEGKKIEINTHEALRLFELRELVSVLLKEIDTTLHGKQVNLQVGEQFYALNDITRLRLNNLINGQLVQEDVQMSSDNELILNIRDLENINIFIVPQKHLYKRNNGSFFPFYNNTKI